MSTRQGWFQRDNLLCGPFQQVHEQCTRRERTQICRFCRRLRLWKHHDWERFPSSRNTNIQFCIKNSYPANPQNLSAKFQKWNVWRRHTHHMVVEVPCYHPIERFWYLRCERSYCLRCRICSDTRLIIHHLLLFVVLFEHREQKNDIGILKRSMWY